MVKEKMQRKDVFVADFAEYLIDFIMKSFSIIFKGKEISRKGANALALFILTITILYPNTTFPNNIGDFIKIYGVSSIFLIYFLVDVLQNVDKINRILRKFQQKTDLAYEDIMNNTVTGDEVENLLNSISFNCNQLENIIHHLRANNQFTRLAQYNLLLKSNDFTIDTDNYIQQLLVEDEVNGENEKWDSLAICTYIRIKKLKLSESFSKKIYEKYKDEPSIVFCMGRFLHIIDVEGSNKRLLLAGNKMPFIRLQRIIMGIYKILIVVPLALSVFQLALLGNNEYQLYAVLSVVFFAIGVSAINWLRVELIKFRIKKSFKYQNINPDDINFDKLIYDLT